MAVKESKELDMLTLKALYDLSTEMTKTSIYDPSGLGPWQGCSKSLSSSPSPVKWGPLHLPPSCAEKTW